MTACSHLDTVEVFRLPEEVPGCPECIEAGEPWCHLRICLQCGQVGCCDSSPAKHASKHAAATGHPLMRSIEPGEDWSWCYIDDVAIRLSYPTGEPRIPPSPLCP